MACIHYFAPADRWRVAWYVGGGRRRWATFRTEAEARAFDPPGETSRAGTRGNRARTTAEIREVIAANIQVDPCTGCWGWTGPVTNKGYAQLTWKRKNLARESGAHRISYVAHVGEIPTGLVIDHLCRNPLCVNREHLEPVQQIENAWASAQTLAVKNGTKTHCPQGHLYDAGNTYWYGPDSRWRQCRKCLSAHARRSYLKRKALSA